MSCPNCGSSCSQGCITEQHVVAIFNQMMPTLRNGLTGRPGTPGSDGAVGAAGTDGSNGTDGAAVVDTAHNKGAASNTSTLLTTLNVPKENIGTEGSYFEINYLFSKASVEEFNTGSEDPGGVVILPNVIIEARMPGEASIPILEMYGRDTLAQGTIRVVMRRASPTDTFINRQMWYSISFVQDPDTKESSITQVGLQEAFVNFDPSVNPSTIFPVEIYAIVQETPGSSAEEPVTLILRDAKATIFVAESNLPVT